MVGMGLKVVESFGGDFEAEGSWVDGMGLRGDEEFLGEVIEFFVEGICGE